MLDATDPRPTPRAAWRRLAVALLTAAALAAASADAFAQQGRGTPAKEPGAARLALFDAARSGEGDPHLPYVLTSLKKALTSQDAISLLELVDPAYFRTQFGAMSAGGRSPGAALNQFTCELLSICDVSKSYRLNDVVSMLVVAAEPTTGSFAPRATDESQPVAPPSKLFEVKLELRMWDGVTVVSTIFYDPATTKLFGAVG